ncbi:glutathione S-transferase family protein [Variovorax saccharolyticus]|uniref:glutathione S-transferase family protein n=1 Tax=Variovorax saccharolyticus TaxID=3053516 RepID=UPI0025788F29|nr:glutathione S-transferase family protein [Variovorax sp. J22R187]MDM0022843.1 glutathione S-transferase family protein [Variovorax sp. J22R187]
MATAPFVLYGAPGSGATPVHAALTLMDLPVKVVDVAPWQGEHERGRLSAVNPMRQVPVLVLPSGEIMTESAAILVWLADRYPAAGLAPHIDDPTRAQFLRWMSFVSAAIYSLYWVRDEPSRLASSPEAEATVLERTTERIAQCWRDMDAQMPRGPRYLLGDRLSVLDLYVTVVSRWQPRRLRFYREAPRMAEVVRRVDTEPRLLDHWAARYPFGKDWESEGP